MVDLFRIKGLIQGTALGDSFGMATEFMSRHQIVDKFGKVTDLMASDADSVISKNCPRGSVTDDTFNSLMIYQMLKDHDGAIDTTSYLQSLQAWVDSNDHAKAVTGPSTSKALELIKQGVDVHLTGIHGVTNGAAMKIAPLGIYTSYLDLPELISKVKAICLPTHNTPIALCGASIVCALSSYVLTGQRSRNEMFILVNRVIQHFNQQDELIQQLQQKLQMVFQLLNDVTDEELFLNQLYEHIGCGVAMVETIPAVIGILFFTLGHPEKSCCLAASLGGDTDTIGAITTAINGAIAPDLIDQSKIKCIEQVNQLDLSNY